MSDNVRVVVTQAMLDELPSIISLCDSGYNSEVEDGAWSASAWLEKLLRMNPEPEPIVGSDMGLGPSQWAL